MNQIVLSDNDAIKKEKINEFTKGERPDGEKIGEYRNAEYAFFKKAINPLAGGYVDLLLTRSFANKMFIKSTNKGYLLDSTDSKTGNLIGKYGLDIMSINQEWFNKRQAEIYKFVLQFEISKILNRR